MIHLYVLRIYQYMQDLPLVKSATYTWGQAIGDEWGSERPVYPVNRSMAGPLRAQRSRRIVV
jgi:hypothetical protein